jgi:mRNA interferase RelE/StbE
MFDVILSPEAKAFFADAGKPLALKLARCFEQLEREPRRHSNIKRLSGARSGLSRYRVGDWRVIYRKFIEKSADRLPPFIRDQWNPNPMSHSQAFRLIMPLPSSSRG